MQGIFVIDGGFDLLCGETAIGRRRHLDESAVAALKGFSDRYARLVSSSHLAAGFLELGHDLYSWLDGDGRNLTALLQQADRPLRFEVCAADRYPGDAAGAVGVAGRRERLPSQ
jgi:hypothetical protein